MMPRKHWPGWLFILLFVVLVVQPACDRPDAKPVGSALNQFGQPATPFRDTTVATVLVFVAVDYPISSRYAPDVQRLHKHFAPLGIQFWIVYPDKDTTLNALRRHAQDFGLGDHLLWDPEHVLVHLARARITPEVAVFQRPGTLVYHGQIDDRYVALGTERPAPTRHFLEEILEAVLEHRPIPTNQTQAVGCSIPD